MSIKSKMSRSTKEQSNRVSRSGRSPYKLAEVGLIKPRGFKITRDELYEVVEVSYQFAHAVTVDVPVLASIVDNQEMFAAVNADIRQKYSPYINYKLGNRRVVRPEQHDLYAKHLDVEIAQWEEEQERERQKLVNYTGDQYLTDSWIEDGYSFDAAKAIAEVPSYISLIVEMGELASILADKYATATLRKLLLECNPHILSKLGEYARRRRVRRKPGRKPKKGGQHMYERVYELHKSGLSLGQTAIRIWGPKAKRNLADAHYRRALRHGFQPVERRKQK